MDKTEISKRQIDQSKMLASSGKYFALFEKHVPRNLGHDANILIYEICNLGCILKMIELNPSAHYIVVGNSSCNNALELFLGETYNIDYRNEFDFKENDMKFDCIIMNPPYQRNLHLKILAEAIKHLKDEKSVCVNLSPVRWLQDPLAKYKKNSDYKKFENSISKHIESLDIITANAAQCIFNGTVMNIDLGIYKCNTSQINKIYNNIGKDIIIDKCIDYIITHNPLIEANKQDGWRVRMPIILGGKSGGSGDRGPRGLMNFGKLLAFNDGKSKDGKWWYDCYMRNQYSKTTPYITSSIKFNTENEANNFIQQFNTNFVKYVTDKLLSDVNVAPEKVVFMQDYSKPWDDARFYKFFNITPEEQKFIEDTMKKYAAK